MQNKKIIIEMDESEIVNLIQNQPELFARQTMREIF
jgi:hypothetical protein